MSKDKYKVQGHKKCNKCKLYTWNGENRCCLNIRCPLNDWLCQLAVDRELSPQGGPPFVPTDDSWRFEEIATHQFGQDNVPQAVAATAPDIEEVHSGDTDVEGEVGPAVNQDEEDYRRQQAEMRGRKRKADVLVSAVMMPSKYCTPKTYQL